MLVVEVVSCLEMEKLVVVGLVETAVVQERRSLRRRQVVVVSLVTGRTVAVFDGVVMVKYWRHVELVESEVELVLCLLVMVNVVSVLFLTLCLNVALAILVD